MPFPNRSSSTCRLADTPEMANDHPLSPGGMTHVLLDANVLLPPRLSDVLFDMCLAGLYSARWTLDIENEFLRSWPKVATRKTGGGLRQQATERAKAERRLACYKAAVPDHEILGYDHPDVLASVPDAVASGDRHVAAAALVLLHYARRFNASDKVYIVSNNLKHMAISDMAQLGIVVVSPGQFIDSLAQADSVRVGQALEAAMSSLSAPPYTRELLLDALLLHGARSAVQYFAGAWGINPRSTLSQPGSPAH